MRVTFVTSSLACGGSEASMVTLANALVERGWSITVLLGEAPGAAHFFNLDRRVTCVELGFVPRGSFFARFGTYARGLLSLRRAILKSSPDVVVSFLDWINSFVVVALLGSGIRTVVSQRAPLQFEPLNWFWRGMRHLTYPAAAGFVSVVPDSLSDETAKPHQIQAVIPGPIASPRNVKPLAASNVNGAFRIVAVGRLHHQKGFDLLIDAYAMLVPDIPASSLWIFGEGALRAQLEKKVATLNLGSRSFLPGPISDPYAELAQADLFVLSSRFEGYPRALAEAMMMGLPVVSFDCPGAPGSMIVHEHNGLLVPMGDTRSLAQAILRLARDPALRRKLGENARAVSHQCGVPAAVDAWITVLQGVVTGHRL
jgi:glycosyltransferase involved in cell wall biosynthesis